MSFKRLFDPFVLLFLYSTFFIKQFEYIFFHLCFSFTAITLFQSILNYLMVCNRIGGLAFFPVVAAELPWTVSLKTCPYISSISIFKIPHKNVTSSILSILTVLGLSNCTHLIVTVFYSTRIDTMQSFFARRYVIK